MNQTSFPSSNQNDFYLDFEVEFSHQGCFTDEKIIDLVNRRNGEPVIQRCLWFSISLYVPFVTPTAPKRNSISFPDLRYNLPSGTSFWPLSLPFLPPHFWLPRYFFENWFLWIIIQGTRCASSGIIIGSRIFMRKFNQRRDRMFWNDLVERKIFIFKFLYEMSLEWNFWNFRISICAVYISVKRLMRIIYRWCSHHAWFSIAFQALIRKESIERRKRVFSTLFLPFSTIRRVFIRRRTVFWNLNVSFMNRVKTEEGNERWKFNFA